MKRDVDESAGNDAEVVKALGPRDFAAPAEALQNGAGTLLQVELDVDVLERAELSDGDGAGEEDGFMGAVPEGFEALESSQGCAVDGGEGKLSLQRECGLKKVAGEM